MRPVSTPPARELLRLGPPQEGGVPGKLLVLRTCWLTQPRGLGSEGCAPRGTPRAGGRGRDSAVRCRRAFAMKLGFLNRIRPRGAATCAAAGLWRKSCGDAYSLARGQRQRHAETAEAESCS